MKKKLYPVILIIMILFTTGCFKNDKMEDINIVTTIYPIEYVANRLYGEHSSITSIYPKGILSSEYKITNKQLKDFSNSDLFIYDGETSEREYATSMLSYNKNLKIIDAAYGLDSTYSYSDIWLNPSNILMIAQNIRNELKEYMTSSYMIEELNNKYDLFKIDISEIETELTKTSQNSTDNRIITSDETLNYLEKYGFEVINLTENGKEIENNVALAESLLSSRKLSYIYVIENRQENNVVKSLKEAYGCKTLIFRSLETIDEDDLEEDEDYLSLMHANVELLKQETYK